MADGGLAIIAGRGVLPKLIAEECARADRPYQVIVFEGMTLEWCKAHPQIPAVFEKPGRLISDLKSSGCDEVTLAGAMTRPDLNPLKFDLKMLRIAPKVLAGIKSGDDATLRLIAQLFEAEGFLLRAPHELLAGLLARPGVRTQAGPDGADRADAARAAQIVAALGAVDVGQGAVVVQGQCLGVESLQGTDAMLEFVRQTARGVRPDPAGGRGVLYKAPKKDQDWRIDLPAVGPDTVRNAAKAGLAGIAVHAGGVLILGYDETIAAADATGLFLWGREAGA